MQMPSDLPSWVQEVSLVAVAVTSVIIAVYRYIKSETSKATTPTPEPTNSSIDTKSLRQLGDNLYDFQEDMERVANKIIRSMNELNKTLQELIDEKRS